ncbi:hypothetical protein MHU86_15215 [Fragilaria crotonensis]|nr:hypothetical protein MHU86_15215 [Fragilaria crotonensis]
MKNAPSRDAVSKDKGGMSRAAKKRAKKRQKKPTQVESEDDNHHVRDEPDFDVTDDDEDDEQLPPPRNKKHKVNDQVPSKQKAKTTAAIPKQKEPNSSGGEDDDVDDDVDDNKSVPDESNDDVDDVDDLVQSLLSKLTPAQILQQAVIEESVAITTVGTEQVDLRDIVQEITSQQRAKCLLQSILGDTPISQFYANHWEQEPLLVRTMAIHIVWMDFYRSRAFEP